MGVDGHLAPGVDALDHLPLVGEHEGGVVIPRDQSGARERRRYEHRVRAGFHLPTGQLDGSLGEADETVPHLIRIVAQGHEPGSVVEQLQELGKGREDLPMHGYPGAHSLHHGPDGVIVPGRKELGARFRRLPIESPGIGVGDARQVVRLHVKEGVRVDSVERREVAGAVRTVHVGIVVRGCDGVPPVLPVDDAIRGARLDALDDPPPVGVASG